MPSPPLRAWPDPPPRLAPPRYLLDEENAGVIRSHSHLKALCKLAGLSIVRSSVQENFPADLHTVRMYWLVAA